MRTHYASLLFTALALPSVAQDYTLTSNELPAPGSSLTYRIVNNLNVIDITQGTNITWNMSGIMPTAAAPYDVDFMTPAQTPHPTAFPNSNYATFESEIPRYNYYNKNATVMEKVGSWASNQNTYTNGQIEFTFPMQVGTTYTDPWESTNSSFDGTFQLTCVGSGTLMLPGATHTNVLLVRILLVELFNIEMYQWVSATNGAQLLVYFPGDGSIITEAASYVTSMVIGIEEVQATIDLRVQSIVQDHLNFTYTSGEALDAVILSASGQLLRTERLPATRIPSTWPMEVSGLAPGMYFLSLRDARGEHATARFVKH